MNHTTIVRNRLRGPELRMSALHFPTFDNKPPSLTHLVITSILLVQVDAALGGVEEGELHASTLEGGGNGEGSAGGDLAFLARDGRQGSGASGGEGKDRGNSELHFD